MFTLADYQKSCDYIRGVIPDPIRFAAILGTGFGDSIRKNFTILSEIPYREIPNFPVSTAPDHAGKLVFVRAKNGGTGMVLSGRFHYYEGYTMEELVYPIRVMKLLGIGKLIVTNAAGSVNERYSPGDLMLITDHIKLGFDSPVRGQNLDAFGGRFFDMGQAYDKSLQKIAKDCAGELGVGLREGVYFYATGPQFETPAEIRAFRMLGADAVGMSTVPEVIEAAHCGIRVLGISCLTNMAAGITGAPVTSEEVGETMGRATDRFSDLLYLLADRI